MDQEFSEKYYVYKQARVREKNVGLEQKSEGKVADMEVHANQKPTTGKTKCRKGVSHLNVRDKQIKEEQILEKISFYYCKTESQHQPQSLQ